METLLSLLLVGNLLMANVTVPFSLPAAPVPSSVAPLVKVSSELSARAALVMASDSATMVFAKNSDQRLPMASLTKLVSALVLLSEHGVREVVTVPRAATLVGGSGAKLRPGERMQLGDLLAAAMIQSANDAITAAALHDSATIADFSAKMNELVTNWGLRDTRFTNPIGYDDPQHYSTAFELALIGRKALAVSLLRELGNTAELSVSSISGGYSYFLQTTNELLGWQGIYGLKTGTTEAAGQCLIVAFRAHGREYIAVVLGSEDRWADMRALVRAVRG